VCRVESIFIQVGADVYDKARHGMKPHPGAVTGWTAISTILMADELWRSVNSLLKAPLGVTVRSYFHHALS
jgi:hypothetical protein